MMEKNMISLADNGEMESEIFALVVNQSSNSIMITNNQGVIEYVNETFVKLTGYTKEEILGKNSRILKSDKTSIETLADIKKALLKGKRWEGKLYSRKKDGELFWGHIVILEQQRTSSGKLKTIYINYDLTETKKAEDELRSSEERFEKIFYLCPDAVVVKSVSEGRYTAVNYGFTQIMGYSEAEVIGKSSVVDLDIWVNPEDRKLLLDKLKNETFVSNFEIQLRTKSGDIRDCLMSANIIDVDDVQHIVSITRDITEHKKIDRELQDTLKRLRASLAGILNVVYKMMAMRDSYTASHQKSVSVLARRIAQKMNLSENQAEDVRMAALIHDIGKMEVPFEILTKHTKLKPAQWELIKDHVFAGFDALEDSGFSEETKRAVREHHEKLDGTGYPCGLKDDQISILARILSVADITDAMMNLRPYREALGVDAAIVELMGKKGSVLDSAVVDACIQILLEDKKHTTQ